MNGLAIQSAGLEDVLRATLDRPATTAFPKTPEQEAEESSIPKKRAAVEEQMRLAQKALRESKENETTSSSPSAQGIDLLKQLDLLYLQQQSAIQRGKELEHTKTEAKTALKQLREKGPQEQKPYSFFLRESLQDELASRREQLKSVVATNESLAQALSRAKETFDAKEKERRLAQEKLDAAANTPQAADLKTNHDLAKLESKIAGANVAVRQAELANNKTQEETLRLRVQFLEEKLQRIDPEVHFTDEDLNQRLLELKTLDREITRKSLQNDSEASILKNEWAKAREQQDQSNKPTPEILAEVEARHLAYVLQTNRTDYYTKQIAWAQRLRDIWKRRYSVATGQFKISDLSKWLAEAQAFHKELSDEKSIQNNRLDELRKMLSNVEQLNSQDDKEPVERWTQYQAEVIRNQMEFVNDHVARAEATSRTVEKLVDEIRQRTSQYSLEEWTGIVWQQIVAVWNYELIRSKDDQSLRVRTVVYGLLLLGLGYLFSRRLSHAFGTKVLPRFGVNQGGAAAFESLSFYALLFITTLMALKVVNVPLTLFTFLGGAAAIGFGFGSQNSFNNFISSLILLAEQPVRVGDLIELAGLVGSVDSIGMRSTKIRTASNQEIIVPNSSFLENNVVNWTLSDTTIRCKVDVGVAYGSPTRDVARWLKRAAEEHGLVLKKPESFVWFSGFGDNSLNFELYFFITIRTLAERRRIESDLRFMIDQYFRDANISIAFPQRDIHLDTQRPLEVRMLPTEPEQSSPEETKAA